MKLNEKESARKLEVVKQMGTIEKEAGGFSNIPLSHPDYWNLRRELGNITSKENS